MARIEAFQAFDPGSNPGRRSFYNSYILIIKMVNKLKHTHVLICPKCNSKDISTDFSNAGFVGTGLFNNIKVCNNCGYTHSFFPEVEIKNTSKNKKF
jgi:hypothetical protein